MATGLTPDTSAEPQPQEGEDESSTPSVNPFSHDVPGGYYDIMILGKTGMGKTTTTDKLLLANPTGAKYEYDASAQDRATTCPLSHGSHASERAEGEREEGDQAARSRKASTIHASTKYNDLSMWHLSREQDLEKVERRLKDLVYWRLLEDPHLIINETRKTSASTKSCQLLSNDTSKVRVLDVPGFYGPEDNDSDSDSEVVSERSEGATACVERSIFDTHEAGLETDLSIMRKILHIKVAVDFRFNRIVYFLPDSGVLHRVSRNLKTELRVMERYFKRTVFESMVVVATQNRSVYDKMREGCEIFNEEDMKTTRKYFYKAMRKIFPEGDFPKPPVIYISLNDTSDEICTKITEAKVVKEGVGLTFNPSTCARCGIHIGKLADPNDIRNIEKIDDLAIAVNDPGSVAIPYDESTCHPRLVPKYHTIQCVVGGLVHILTFKRFMGNWPYFGNVDEVCINCGKPPKSRGCVKIGMTFYHKKAKDGIVVDHTSDVEENYIFVLDQRDSIPRLEYNES